jgi:hypothetical protein
LAINEYLAAQPHGGEQIDRPSCKGTATLGRGRNFDPFSVVNDGTPKGIPMRAFAVLAMLTALLHVTAAESENAKTDPMNVPDAENSAESEGLMTLQEFAKHLESAGYSDVTVVPQTGVVQAKDKVGNPIKMIVNTETMVAVQLKDQDESETTGSGSSDETQSLWERRER